MNENNIKKLYAEHDVNKEQLRVEILSMSELEAARKKRPFKFKHILAVSVSLLLVIGGFSAYAVTAEAKEYKAAVKFFEEYELPTEGLTRSEIKAVYKDITMKTYSYEKTIELLDRISIEMYSTNLGSADKESLDALWNNRNNTLNGDSRQEHSEIWYDVEYIDLTPENSNNSQADSSETPWFMQSVIVKYHSETELWRYEVPYDMFFSVDDNTIQCDDGLIVYGYKECYSSDSGNACVFMLDNDGKLLWEYSDSSAGSAFETAVRDDKEIILFGHEKISKNEYVNLFTILNTDGEVQKRNTSVHDGFARYKTVVKIGNCYLAKRFVRRGEPEDYTIESELISVSADGELADTFTYSDGGENYRIEDIIYHDGRVYLSALRPNIPDEDFSKSFSELNKEFFDAWQAASPEAQSELRIDMPEEYNERLRKLFAEQYTAVLLVCDEGAVINKAYSAANARAGKLGTDESGNLTWQTMRIDDVKNVNMTISSRCVDILATEFSFVFDENGKMLEKQEIGAYPMSY